LNYNIRNGNNNFENKFKFHINGNQTDISSFIYPQSDRTINRIAFNYNSYIQKTKVRKKPIIRVCNNIGIKNIIKDPKRKINIIAHNYSTLGRNTGNKSQKTSSIISDYYCKNDYFNKTDNQINKNNMIYKTNSEFNYRLKDRNLDIQNNKNRIKNINNIYPLKDMKRTINNTYTKDIHYKRIFNNL